MSSDLEELGKGKLVLEFLGYYQDVSNPYYQKDFLNRNKNMGAAFRVSSTPQILVGILKKLYQDEKLLYTSAQIL